MTPQPPMTESDLQDMVIELARRLKWKAYHTYDARRSEAGYPDLTLVRPPRVVFAELKSTGGRLRQEQREWADILSRIPGVEYELWRPADWDRICEVLR